MSDQPVPPPTPPASADADHKPEGRTPRPTPPASADADHKSEGRTPPPTPPARDDADHKPEGRTPAIADADHKPEGRTPPPTPPASADADNKPERRTPQPTPPASASQLEDTKQFRENRIKSLNALKDLGKDPYCSNFSVTISHAEFNKKFKDLDLGQYLKYMKFNLAGRIMAKRKSGSRLYFYDFYNEGHKVQIMANSRESVLDDIGFSDLHSNIKRGDIVGVSGYPGKTRAGELSVSATEIYLLSYCLHPLPMPNANPASRLEWTPGTPRCPKSYVLKDQDTRWRYRFQDLMMNPDIRGIFDTRAKIIKFVRGFLDDLGFLEVETPIMNTSVGGGVARPFTTHHDELGVQLYLRIAPELNLKQLVVGGLHKVYEIGKQFRLEGTDSTHHPEFTSCEFYMAFANYNDLIRITEDMLSGMVKKLTGGYTVMFHANGFDKEPIEIDFTPPFRKVEMIEELEKVANLNIPSDLSSEEANKYLVSTCDKFGVRCPAPQTTARLLDKLVGHFLEGSCVNPTFIMHHPEVMSAMAKSHPSKPTLTERFELFICQQEICNAYSELNDPEEQRRRFKEQLKARDMGDDEVAEADENFILSLEYGLPPTAGWGIGIDRMVMLLTDSHNIKDVILFPGMRGRGGGGRASDSAQGIK